MKYRAHLIVACAALLGAGAVWFALPRVDRSSHLRGPSSHEAGPLAEGDAAYRKGNIDSAISAYSDYVRKNESARDKSIQDEVSKSRIRLAFAYAKKDDFAKAREILKGAERNHRGTDTFSPDEGSIPDQASYQAAVCSLNIDKKVGIADLKAHIDRYPESPTVYSALRRLQRLLPAADYEAVQSKAERKELERAKKIELSASMCGPKAVAHLLGLLGKPVPDEATLAKQCGTTAAGSSMAGLKKALATLGVETHGYALARGDFERTPLPALWLRGDHFLVLTRITESAAEVFDPATNSKSVVSLPPIDDLKFSANVLTLNPLELTQG